MMHQDHDVQDKMLLQSIFAETDTHEEQNKKNPKQFGVIKKSKMYFSSNCFSY
jgi:hypothetical protein